MPTNLQRRLRLPEKCSDQAGAGQVVALQRVPLPPEEQGIAAVLLELADPRQANQQIKQHW